MRSWMVGLCVALALAPVSVWAADARVDWPTFFRVGPSQRYQVVDEILRGTVVDVRSCTEAWCLVQYGRTLGYVRRAALNATDFPSSGAPPGTDCFESTRAGYGKGQVERFCRR